MKVFLFCLPIISGVFMIIYFVLLRLLKEERFLIYKRIIAIIICISFALQAVFAADNQVLNFVCAILWGIDVVFNFFR